MVTRASVPACARTRPTFWDGLVAAAVLAAAVAIFFYLKPAPSNFLTAEIVLANETIARYDLSALVSPVYLPIEDVPYPLTVELAPGRVRISESVCPGEDCVRTGWADQSGQQIICLPNRLVISLTGAEPQLGEIDGVTK